MRVLIMALSGALLTIVVAGSVEAQSITDRQAAAARAKAGMDRGMSGGIFSEKGKKPTIAIKRGTAASSSPAPAFRYLAPDAGPMPVPTYLLRNGITLQATHGIAPAQGVKCIAYCPG